MSKAPKNLPDEGDHCTLRGYPHIGTVISINKDDNWVFVDWHGSTGPKICHLFELEKYAYKK